MFFAIRSGQQRQEGVVAHHAGLQPRARHLSQELRAANPGGTLQGEVEAQHLPGRREGRKGWRVGCFNYLFTVQQRVPILRQI